MFSNLTSYLINQLPFDSQSEILFQKLRSNPDLTFFQVNSSMDSSDNSSKNFSNKNDLDKASLLSCLQTIVDVSLHQNHLHQQTCSQFISSMRSSNIPKVLFSQFPSFSRVVVLETLIVIQSVLSDSLLDDNYFHSLINFNSDSHHRFFLGFMLFQAITKFNDSILAKFEEDFLDSFKILLFFNQ